MGFVIIATVFIEMLSLIGIRMRKVERFLGGK